MTFIGDSRISGGRHLVSSHTLSRSWARTVHVCNSEVNCSLRLLKLRTSQRSELGETSNSCPGGLVVPFLLSVPFPGVRASDVDVQSGDTCTLNKISGGTRRVYTE